MEEGRVGAYGERKIRVCPQRRPRNASGHRARRNQRPKGWRHWIASWRFQPNPFVKWSRVSRSRVDLRTFVVARINPLRRIKDEPPAVEDVLKTMRDRATKFNVEKIRPQDLASIAGAPADEE